MTLSALRMREVIPKMAFVLVGCFIPVMEQKKLPFPELAFLTLSSFLFALAIYSLNSFWGYQNDEVNPRLIAQTKIRKVDFLWAAIAFVSFGLVFLVFLPIASIVLGILIFFMWLIYSLPGGIKGVPFAGVGIAFFTQVVHYLLGFSIFEMPITMEVMLLAIYFAMMVASGHLLHEYIDFTSDQKVGIKTTAVFMGLSKTLSLSFIFQFSALILISCYWLFFGFKPNSLLMISSLISLTSHPLWWPNLKENIFLYRRWYLLNYGFISSVILTYGYLTHS